MLPGGIMFSIFGFVGQHVYNIAFDKSAAAPDSTENAGKEMNVFERFAQRKWSPFSILTDEEYVTMLDEKLLRVNAELAVVDDRIAELKIMEKESAAVETERKAKEQLDDKAV